jgi:uncharacterized protein (DUF433 family)
MSARSIAHGERCGDRLRRLRCLRSRELVDRRVAASVADGAGRPGTLVGMNFARITVRPDQMGGVPCIRGLRIPVATVVGMVADGMSEQEILAAYPDLEAEDVREALRYAAEALRERELPLVASG